MRSNAIKSIFAELTIRKSQHKKANGSSKNYTKSAFSLYFFSCANETRVH